jgi:hypothetical protein
MAAVATRPALLTSQARGSALTAPVLSVVGRHQPALAGYYNADGMYHSNSDNTDRDLETGGR